MPRQSTVIDAQERRFLAQRARLLRWWPAVGGALLAAELALIIWLFAKAPLLINPVIAVHAIEQGGLAPSMAYLMAGILPMAVWAALLLMFALLMFGFVWSRRERRYQEMIARLDPT